jgi:hypothetical protein
MARNNYKFVAGKRQDDKNVGLPAPGLFMDSEQWPNQIQANAPLSIAEKHPVRGLL